MSIQLLLNTALIITNAVFHVSCLVWLAGVLKRIRTSSTFTASRKSVVRALVAYNPLQCITVHN